MHSLDLIKLLAYQKKAVMRKQLIYRCQLSTEISSTDDEIKDLQDLIIHTSKHGELWHKEIPRRYFWFEEILLENRDTRVIMSFDEIVQLGKERGYPVTDKQEFHMFLSYQHDVRNVVFHQDIPEFIIISVGWFFGLINVLIATFYESSSFECKKSLYVLFYDHGNSMFCLVSLIVHPIYLFLRGQNQDISACRCNSHSFCVYF
jgi:hypothetical protein